MNNLQLTQNKAPNGSNVITLRKTSEEEKMKIIKIGFDSTQERKISLKNYSESTKKYTLFESKVYFIKSETIRRKKVY